MTLDELASRQTQTGEEIARIARNYKKDSATRKDVPYLQKRLADLDAQWNVFEATDTEIRLKHDTELDHPYFSKNYYDAVKSIYEGLREELSSKITTLRSTAGKAPITDEDSVSTELPASKSPADAPNPTDGHLSTHQPARSTAAPRDSGNSQSSIRSIIRRQQSVMDALQRALNSLPQDNQPQSQQFYQVKIKTLERYWMEVENLHHTIWEQSEDPTKEGYAIDDYYNLEEITQGKIIELQERLSPRSEAINMAHTDGATPMKLPKVVLPKFDGNYLNWKQFHDLFLQMVHKQPIGNAQKMWYLKTNLSGEAERLIRHLPLSDSNYISAWDILKNRYENQRLLVTALLDKLLSQPAMSSESAAALKTLHDVTNECLLGLQNLGIATETWDPFLLHILTKRLDHSTHSLYEQSLESPREIQEIQKFLSFIETRFQSLEALGNSKRLSTERASNKCHKSSALVSSTTKILACKLCKGDHGLFACSNFLKLSPQDRLKQTRRLQLCINCLKTGHNSSKCPAGNCSKCKGKHNTLLHLGNPAVSHAKPFDNFAPTSSHTCPTKFACNNTNLEIGDHRTNLAAQHTSQPNGKYMFLGTALINVKDQNGNLIPCRAIVDSGSQVNFITESLCKRLKLNPTKNPLQISGVGDSKVNTTRRANILISSRVSGYSTRLDSHILKEIASHQPQYYFDTSSWAIPKNIQLADPEFFKPQKVDVLIGVEHFCELLSVGQIKLGANLPSLQNTTLGWMVFGVSSGSHPLNPVCGISNIDLDSQLQRLWALEDFPESKPQTPDEQKCEMFFNKTTKRNSDGRFIVRLPLIDEPKHLGQSRDIALKRFYSLERKLARNPEMKQQYSDFLREYIELGHMEEIFNPNLEGVHYFLPHHCVLKPSSTTTKLRVVFDASAKTSNNLSLNDMMLIGPTIQDDLFSIILRFRTYKYVFTADVEKMYRQILVAQEDRKLQMIIWRENPEEALKYYQLNTVTYGTASAPYLAVKCLQTLAELERSKFPLASEAVKDFYVDDIITGSNNLKEAIEIQDQLQKLLATGRFQLRKWCANHPALLQRIPKENWELQLDFNDGTNNNHIKTLGISWQPKIDAFTITANVPSNNNITKRSVLADVAHVFDPLGLVNPVIVLGKIFIQQLWLLKVAWDEALPQELHTQWSNFRQDLIKLNSLKIPRFILSKIKAVNIQLHAFSDASEKAYGTALYIRTKDIDGAVTTQLLCAKSRVAPTKKITLPRLELCAAKLTAELVDRVKRVIKLNFNDIYLWTDSTIVLSWISTPSSNFQTFVANRISAIQGLSEPSQWRHVETRQNPADLVSRGMTPKTLLNSKIWFNGPEFLKQPEVTWPKKKINETSEYINDMETKGFKFVLAANATTPTILSSINHKNSFTRLQRIIAYLLRFKRNIRTSKEHRILSRIPQANEIYDALIFIMKEVQCEEFFDELKNLRQTDTVKASSKLRALVPFIDESGLIRVGGRLQAASLPRDMRHPILLPHAHWVTRILMEYIHKKHMHAGPQALLALTRQRFWPLKGKQLAQSIVHHCIICARARPKLITQIMGNLPSERVQSARPFVNVGIDFCGPIYVHYKIRGKQPTKTYIAVFICFATKACHLELVTDLTSAAFIGSLKRFIARRGRPHKIFCDNATNFVGARNELKELQELFSSKENQDKVLQICAEEQIQWCPIPPRSPHFGGLWEAAVKSAKHHLRRVLAGASLTYEETSTVITEIEAILNSRPLTPLSSDANDLQALTPGHFLIGEPLTSLPNPHSTSNQSGLLTRWRLVTALQQEFWKRWSTEYLQQLQTRSKWTEEGGEIKLGTIVLLRDENQPPLKWAMGKIIKTYPGNDGRVRVVEVQTGSGVTKRAIQRISPLPVTIEDDSPQDEVAVEAHKNCSTVPTISVNKNCLPPKPRKRKIHPINPNWHLNPSAMEVRCTALQKNLKHTASSSEEHATPDRQASISQPGFPSKKGRGNLSTLIVTTLICCLLPITRADVKDFVEITTFKSNPGIFFEGLGQASMISDEWSLIVFYEMENYWKEISVFKEGLLKIQNLCRPLDMYKQYCLTTSNLFQHQLDTIEATNKLLQGTHYRKWRNRRSPLNIIGNIANKLFGILDEEYAENMAQTITEINSNEKHLLELIKNQTSVIDSTLNIMEKENKYVNNQLNLVGSHINQIREELRTLKGNLSEERILDSFNSLAINMILTLTEYQRIQTALIDVVTDAHRGKINPLLLTPKQLQEELQLIRENLPVTCSVPGQLEQIELRQLYALMVVRARIFKKSIIFDIKVPLINKEKFEIFKVVPVPIYLNYTINRIRPASDFLAVSLHRDQYYQMSGEELSTCTLIREGNYLCRQKHSIYNKNAGPSQCELEFIHKRQNSLPATCNIEQADKSASWSRLNKGWLYSFNSEHVFNIVCGTEAHQIVLKDQGLLRFKRNCVLKHNTLTISSHHFQSTYLHTQLIPDIQLNITQLTDHIKDQNSIHQELHPILIRNNTEEISTLKKQLAVIRTQEDLTDVKATTIHHTILSSTALCISAFVIIYVIVIFIRGKCRSTSTSPPRRDFELPNIEI